MHHILIATKDKTALTPLAEGLTRAGAEVAWAESGAATLEAVKNSQFQLVVLDQNIDDPAPKDLVTQLIMINALMFTALVSDMSEEEFHETMEGLGILAQLPPAPTADDGENLVKRVDKVMGLGK